mgnify:CR=1 FL=1
MNPKFRLIGSEMDSQTLELDRQSRENYNREDDEEDSASVKMMKMIRRRTKHTQKQNPQGQNPQLGQSI